jgi:uncharacterized protein YggE
MLQRFPSIGLILLLLPAVALAQNAPQDLRTISVTGEAMIYVTPDQAVIAVGVDIFAAELDVAKAASDERARRILDAIRKLGIEEKHIATEDLRVALKYKTDKVWDGIAGFIVSRTYVVTLKDVKQLEELFDAAITAGANRVSDVTFTTNELRKHRDRARLLAIEAARDKAQALCAALGCQPGMPRTIQEGGVYYSNMNYRGRANMSQNTVMNDGAGAEGDELAPPGQIVVRASVSVVFDIKPGN